MTATERDDAEDPYRWLEEIDGPSALAWVREQNERTASQLAWVPGHAERRRRVLEVLDSRDRVPQVRRRGAWLYDLWRDDAHPRGLWRRTTLGEFRRADPAWQVVLDLDALAKAEGENWVWAGADLLGPAYRRALLQLSRGGADAVVVREFDVEERRFVDDGFRLPEAKSLVAWFDEDTLLVGTDTGPGSMTESGYPRTVRRWHRGTPLESAETVFVGEPGDVWVEATVDRTPGHERTLISRGLDFYRSRLWQIEPDGTARELAKPEDAMLSFWRERVLMQLRSPFACDGTTHPAGTLLVARAADLSGGDARWQPVFVPSEDVSLAGWTTTRDHIVLDLLEHVVGRLEAAHESADGRWARRRLDTPSPGAIGVAAWHDPLLGDADPLAEHLLLHYEDFLAPRQLLLLTTDGRPPEQLRREPAFFDAAGLRVQQHFATSRDGTRVPYFHIGPRGEPPPGGWPTVLRGYGGFEIPVLPAYSGSTGTSWLDSGHGGTAMIVANLRGGGEYGPAWHQAGIRERKQNVFDDCIAVAEDTIARGLTSPRRLGIVGGSNGGLLVGAVMLQRPDLFNAVVCQVPLLDMRRYHRLLAGASWMAEYGDPDDPSQWAWISRYSPYQNVRAGQRLPAVLFTTSTRDDRVHPGHARKMAARMIEQGHEVLYHENLEGGHGGAADHAQKAELIALEASFLWRQLGAAGD